MTTYVVVSVVCLYPALASPIMADDLFNPFGQFDVAGPGLDGALSFGWEGATQGASFRLLGNPFGAAHNWAWLASAAWLGVSITTFFAVTKYLVLVGCAASVAWCWRWLGAYAGRPVRLRTAFLWVSLALFSTVQIHASWSNDPVANYPVAGYLPAALGFLVVGACARAAIDPNRRTVAAATAMSLVAVTYYELNVGAVIVGVFLMAVGAWSHRRVANGRAVAALIGASIVGGVPAALVLFGRTVTADQASTYTGTTVRLDGAATTFARGTVTSLPGAAWRLSLDALGGQLAIVFFVFGTVALVVCASAWWFSVSPEPEVASDTGLVDTGHVDAGLVDAEPIEAAYVPDRLLVIAAVLAVAGYASFALALQSVTVKVQDEAPRVGYVYTWYAMTSAAVALALAIAMRWIRRSCGRRTKVAAVGVGIALLFVQNTVNWRLAESLSQDYGINRRLVDAFDDDVPVAERCAALVQWRATDWPDYYETGITDGVQEAFLHYFDTDFCPYVPVDG